MRMIHVSVDQGESWNIAQLPAVGHEQFYSILAANNDMVFMHVDEPGGQFPPSVSFQKILYISTFNCEYQDKKGPFFSLRHRIWHNLRF